MAGSTNWLLLPINRLINVIRGLSIKVGDILEYDGGWTIIDLTGPQLITKDMCLALIGAQSTVDPVSVPSGSAIPFSIDMTDPAFSSVPGNFIGQVELLNDVFAAATSGKIIWDVEIEKIWSDDSRTELLTVNIYGHPNDAGTATIDELQVILR